jgi:hypothetical protein
MTFPISRRAPIMRRPSLATAISIAAVFVALSGTAYAATGGTFTGATARSPRAAWFSRLRATP